MGSFTPKWTLPNQLELTHQIRDIWMDSNFWTRSLIRSILYSIGDRDAIKARMEKTANAFESIYSRFYGPEVGRQAEEIYLDYINRLEKLIEAYRDNNLQRIEQHRQLLYDIADKLAFIFSQINRYWDRATLQTQLYELLDATEKQILSMIFQDFRTDVQQSDRYSDTAYKIADTTALGMLRQFQM